MRLLLIEDDARLAGAVRSWLGHGGIAVDWIVNGGEALAALRTHRFDYVVLDLGLPDLGGEEVLRAIRRAGHQEPVIVITAREQVADRVRLLDLGADDFLVKPVHLDELAARLRAITRRRDPHETELRFGALTIVPAARAALRHGMPIALTNKEFWVLETLMRNRDSVTTREQLERALYGVSDDVASNAVEVYVHHLRRKLGADVIRTVRGVGYALHPAS
jgi:DNA-binding response OmpR family regulator